MIHDATELGLAIRNQRKKLGYTQAFISEVTGFSVSFLSDVENGKPTAEIGKVLSLIQYLGMDMTLSERGE